MHATLSREPNTGTRNAGLDFGVAFGYNALMHPPNWKSLRLAAEYGEAASVRKLLDKGVDPFDVGENGMTALMLAARRGRYEIAELLIACEKRKGSPDLPGRIDATSGGGWTALSYAAGGGHQEIAKLLLDSGADHRQTTQDGKTPLMRAAISGHLELVKLLVEKERNRALSDKQDIRQHLDLEDEGGWTALTLATRQKHMEIAELLVRAGANPRKPIPYGETVLMAAARQGCQELVRYLVNDIEKARGSGETGTESDLDSSDKHGWTALALAVHQGHVEIAELFINAGANPISSSPEGETVLMLAAKQGKVVLTQHLVGEMEKSRRCREPCPESHIDFADKRGWTALTLAAQAGHTEIVKMLAGHGADLRQTSPYGQTMLSLAAGGGHHDLLRHLLQSDRECRPAGTAASATDLEATNKGGWTALVLGALGGHLETVQMLIENGANPRQIAPDGRTILILAAQSGNCGLVRWLLDSDQFLLSSTDEDSDEGPGNILDAEDKAGWTALTIAISKGHVEVSRFLLDMGACPWKRLPDGRTILMLAAQHGNYDLVDELLRAVGNSSDRSPRETQDYLNVKNKDGWTALLIAAREGHHEAVCRLLQEIDDPWQTDPNGRTVLMHAARDGHRGVVSDLLPTNDPHDHFSYSSDAKIRFRRFSRSQNMDTHLHLTDQDGWSALMFAVRGGHLDVVEDLCRAGASPRQLSAGGRTPLIVAAATGDHKMVRRLLHKLRDSKYGRVEPQVLCKDVNQYDCSGETALLIACENGFADVVSVLLESGASVVATDPSGNTGLLRAAGGQSWRDTDDENLTQIGRALLNVGADVNASNRNGQTPLSRALANNYFNMTRLLVSAGANVNVPNSGRCSPLAIALAQKSSELVRILVNAGANANGEDDHGQAHLIKAVLDDFTDGVKLLVRSGVALDRADKDGLTALMHAAENGNPEIVRELLRAGADVTATNSEKLNALTLALRNGHSDVAGIILKSPASLGLGTSSGALMVAACLNDVDAVGKLLGPDTDVTGALKIAATLGNLNVVRQLLAVNADSNVLDPDGRTILMVAAQCGHVSVMESLLDFGAKLNTVGPGGRTALMIAAEHEQLQAVRALVSAGANINIQTSQGYTALMFALDTQFSDTQIDEITKALLEGGANVNLSDTTGTTALMMAPDGHAVKLLLDSGADMEAVDQHGRSAFRIALEEDRSSAADALREAGASMGDSPLKLPWPESMGETVLLEYGELTDEDVFGDETALEVAAQNGNVDLVRALLDRGVHHRSQYSCDIALRRAAAEGHDSVAEVLVEVGGASLSGKNYDSPWRIAVENGHLSLAEYLLEVGDGDDIDDNDWRTAAEKGHTSLAAHLLEMGDGDDIDGDDLLMVTEIGDFQLVRILLNSGAIEVNATDGLGMTPLMIAARDGNGALVSLLLDAGGERGVGDEDGRTALMHAACNGHQGATEILADHCVDVADRNGKTALMHAAQHGQTEVVKLLIKNGAQVDSSDNTGDTALQIASKTGNREIENLLKNQS